MIKWTIYPTARWLAFGGVLLSSLWLIASATQHAIADHWAESSNREQELRATRLEPLNAENWYRLGRRRKLDFEDADVSLAISYLQRAVVLNPNSASYWLDLADSYEAVGNFGQAETAYRSAQKDHPISAEVNWRYGNFLLRQNRLEESFRTIARAISADPKMTPVAVSLCWRRTQDVDQILNLALPPEADAYWGAIEFFVSAGAPVEAATVWKRLVEKKSSFPLSKAFPLLDLLMGSGHVDEARIVWQQACSASGIAFEPQENSLIWDGGFEQALLNGGFAWRYRPAAGANINLDEEVVHSGRRSLRVVFDGTANVDFEHIWQFVPVQPNTRYRFASYLRTQEITTDKGMRFQIAGSGISNQFTPSVVGTQPWTFDDVEFTTGPETRLLRISLRRETSTKFGNKIRGTVWVDDVSLVPLQASGLASQ
jgi:tetratricopeptide (TPR) repeat protein